VQTKWQYKEYFQGNSCKPSGSTKSDTCDGYLRKNFACLKTYFPFTHILFSLGPGARCPCQPAEDIYIDKKNKLFVVFLDDSYLFRQKFSLLLDDKDRGRHEASSLIHCPHVDWYLHLNKLQRHCVHCSEEQRR
jgi:hypothetical protein